MPHRYRQIPESLLAQLWQKRALQCGVLTSGDGRRFRVLYPGRRSSAAGPDFRDAIVVVEGIGLLRADVELHVSQRQWDSHHHGRDPRYNSVTLHGVMHSESPTTLLPSGTSAPTLNLTPLLTASPRAITLNPLWDLLARHGYHRPSDTEGVGRLLDRAGDARFLAKSAIVLSLLKEEEPEQVLYEALMEALGYSRNRQPFLYLAHRVPYRQLKRQVKTAPHEQRAPILARTLLTGAGFLSEEDKGKETEALTTFSEPKVSPPNWHLFRIRPSNHPHRRLLGMAHLLDRYWEPGLLAGLEAQVIESNRHTLERGLTVRDDKRGIGTLIGKSRAGDMAVNAVLTFFYALSILKDDAQISSLCLKLYRNYPRLQHNEVTKEMAQQLFPREDFEEITSARRQQGLIHLHRLLAGEYQETQVE